MLALSFRFISRGTSGRGRPTKIEHIAGFSTLPSHTVHHQPFCFDRYVVWKCVATPDYLAPLNISYQLCVPPLI
nr:hypothetical protein Q903MT_gene245 [Picea sitchensis]